MLTKLSLFICLTILAGFSYAQEEALPIDFIELLGELDDEETLTLEEVLTDIESTRLGIDKQTLDADIPDNGATHELR